MLQVILTNSSTRFSVSELAQMAIEGGCLWIRLCLNDCDDAFIKEQLQLIVPLCKESGIMLSFDDRPDLVKEFGLHGVHLNDKKFNPLKIREELGPEAVIGVTCSDPAVAYSLKKADIDYVQLPATFDEDQIATFMVDFRALDRFYPIVASGDIELDDIIPTLALGVSGLAISKAITEADDPVQTISDMLAAIKS